MSSDIFLTPGIPRSMSATAFWNISAAELIPKHRRLYLYIQAIVGSKGGDVSTLFS